ncbi:hypothetical protein WH47_00584 [Habropoda laboriosa]|uniref:Uncharacterized protein n=1 Tax=Habropoda laboriosa TaxID=597456 RepID=A0A0L7RHZ1_9HYME|nr:hypothetical protein WH47_00584 [Habropoda laboriosa]
MLLRGIAFSEARRSVTRRILKPQNSSCEKDNTELTYDEVFQSNLGSKENTYSQSINEHSSTNFLPPEGEAKSFVATASKLAAVEDAAPKGPEASIRSKATALKVSPTARATLQALRSPRNRVSSPLTPSPTTTKDAETITGELRVFEFLSDFSTFFSFLLLLLLFPVFLIFFFFFSTTI